MLEINNYGDLKKSVQTWLNRKDQSTIDNIPIFINFAEKMFTRLIKLPYYETSYIVVWDEGKGFVQLPSDFLSMKHIYVGDSILTRVDLVISGGDTIRKDFVYSSGVLIRIDQSTL